MDREGGRVVLHASCLDEIKEDAIYARWKYGMLSSPFDASAILEKVEVLGILD